MKLNYFKAHYNTNKSLTLKQPTRKVDIEYKFFCEKNKNLTEAENR